MTLDEETNHRPLFMSLSSMKAPTLGEEETQGKKSPQSSPSLDFEPFFGSDHMDRGIG
jgi:hypothetical protein